MIYSAAGHADLVMCIAYYIGCGYDGLWYCCESVADDAGDW